MACIKDLQGNVIWERTDVASLTQADLCGANLVRADLRGLRLTGVDLRNSDLCEADLSGAFLVNAKLTDANLKGAKLVNTFLIGADCSGATFLGADLFGADIRGAKIKDSGFCGALQYVVRIQGSKHEINAIDDDVRIGCERRSLNLWLKRYKFIGDEWGYTEDQISEYGAHLMHIQTLLSLRKKPAVTTTA